MRCAAAAPPVPAVVTAGMRVPVRAEGKLRVGVVTDSTLRTSAPDAYAAGDIAVFYDLMVERHNQMGTWDNAEAHGKVAARNMAGADEDFFDVPTYTTTMFGSTLAVMGVKRAVQPGREHGHTARLKSA